MKIIDKDIIQVTGAVLSRQQLVNALRMLDNYQPPAPKFEVGDIIESTSGSSRGSRYLVIGGSLDNVLSDHYGSNVHHRGTDVLNYTDGNDTWSTRDSREFKKVDALRETWKA